MALKGIAGVVVAVTMAMLLFSPVTAVVNDRTGTQTVTNETVTADAGTDVELRGYDLDPASDTVYWYNITSDAYETATKGTDYDLDTDAGELQVLASGDIEDGTDLKVTYQYDATDQRTERLAALVPTVFLAMVAGVMGVKAVGAL
jgi:hypothetical protein